MTTIRLANPTTDYERLAVIISAHQAEAITAEQLREGDASTGTTASDIKQRYVAHAADGTLAAYGIYVREAWRPADFMYIWIAVDVAYTRQGIGTALWLYLRDRALAEGYPAIETEVRTDSPDGLRFAERQGFVVRNHLYESVITLADFEEGALAEVITQVEAGGIRLSSLAGEGNTPEALHKLYVVNRDTVYDIPQRAPYYPPLEDFQREIAGASWFDPAGQFLAIDIATGEYIGMVAVSFNPRTKMMYNQFTGVRPEYRGRGIALALKLLTIRYARQRGAVSIRTHNHSANAPMLAINRKLGYQQGAGHDEMVWQG